MEDYQNLIIHSLIPSLIALIVSLIIKGSIKNSFDKKLEELKKEHSKEISQFQTELTHLKSKENFKFTKLHQKRFEVLEKTYVYITENYDLIQRFVSPFSQLPETEREIKSIHLVKSHIEFKNYFKSKLIYFDDSTEKMIQDYINSWDTIYFDNEIDRVNEIQKADVDYFTIPYSVTENKLLQIKHQLKMKFRELLG
ncbi:hypothetical protein [Flavobacterium crassostreae]|uniref:Uncharacterized protein n=1 Tax=Flavobacterium crassostreae TaxID=1763534 RepID=A0A1B9DKH5_9FLAO|nr:hypothetical protein [Flavobacterium crassostreae]OCB70198.1 hypothetical protein LPBF_12190 [Flavobacterium crassostreae]